MPKWIRQSVHQVSLCLLAMWAVQAAAFFNIFLALVTATARMSSTHVVFKSKLFLIGLVILALSAEDVPIFGGGMLCTSSFGVEGSLVLLARSVHDACCRSGRPSLLQRCTRTRTPRKRRANGCRFLPSRLDEPLLIRNLCHIICTRCAGCYEPCVSRTQNDRQINDRRRCSNEQGNSKGAYSGLAYTKSILYDVWAIAN